MIAHINRLDPPSTQSLQARTQTLSWGERGSFYGGDGPPRGVWGHALTALKFFKFYFCKIALIWWHLEVAFEILIHA